MDRVGPSSAQRVVPVLTRIRRSIPQPRPSRRFFSLRLLIPTVLFFVYLFAVPAKHLYPALWLRKFTLPNPIGGHNEEGSSWLFGWVWANDGTVSVVDKSPAVTFPARPASFGMELIDPLLGYVIPLSAFTGPCPPPNISQTYSPPVMLGKWASKWKFDADPVLGCPDLCANDSRRPDQEEKWIALVQRGGCPFVEKARQAQKLGASAIVVGGDRDNPDTLLTMYSERDASDVNIAATYIKYWDYVELSSLIASSNTSHNGLRTLSLLITTEFSAWEWYSPIITFIVILLLPTLLTFLTLLIHRIRAARAAQRDRAPEEFVHRLPWRVWTGTGWEKHDAPIAEGSSRDAQRDVELGEASSGEASEQRPTHPAAPMDDEPAWVEQQVECAICLEMFAKGDRVRVLPCQHMFHLDEVDEWLIHKKKLCPVCKADVTQPRVHLPHSSHPDTQPQPLSSPIPGIRSSASSILLGSEPDTPGTPTERTPLLHASS